ncbi:MAG: preprotein translocase subunit SecF [Patescibacteria group bacterium]|jgi:preprotein translocase subunit SecF|nr:preprotein translocase subunit SecF [Patescibacteria group bacterium]
MNIVKHRKIYYLISLILIVPGIISLFVWGLNLSIEFTGGSRMTYTLESVDEKVSQTIESAYSSHGVETASLQLSGNEVIVRSEPILKKEDAKILSDLKKTYPTIKQESFETIGPTIGEEITRKAFYSVIVASLLIVLYITISFRKVPKPATSLRFGIGAVSALLHDVLLLVGLFSIFGHFFNVEIDSLFITALLTVMGFSVHDTIVVYDRIRENLLRTSGMTFDKVVNDSILQTFTRSLNTSVTAMLVLLTLLLFGGENVRWFVVALLIGIASGTYSSIFNAAPLLVTWHHFSQKKKNLRV